MTLEQLNDYKNYFQEEVHYFSGIGFSILQRKFQTVVNILAEIEDIVKENEILKARVQALEASSQTKEAISDVAHDADCEALNI